MRLQLQQNWPCQVSWSLPSLIYLLAPVHLYRDHFVLITTRYPATVKAPPKHFHHAFAKRFIMFDVMMDLHSNSEAETVTATVELPSSEQQDVNIKTHGKHLTISGHLKRSENHEKGGYTVQQHLYGKSSRLWRLYRPG
ncbi:uncharacterized protein F5147DRAFT_654685 [Suillus discolor]|uniref:SHSP domain-containing protein n=1 Tax=Suillus discolor TaxID=1912936 RepID=A0A9P7JRP6_9AGAM|nr:uncharacterized protein F5147DRAFT_654685 [Suillus discolor]KAG2103781.1 hypothetical protein F5147DRAFT_654685 [Suillus discolor]